MALLFKIIYNNFCYFQKNNQINYCFLNSRFGHQNINPQLENNGLKTKNLKINYEYYIQFYLQNKKNRMINSKEVLNNKNTDTSTTYVSLGINNNKYKKFSAFTNLNILKRQTSVQIENKLDKSDDKIVFYKSMNPARSQTSLKSCQTPRKVPLTPRKHIVSSHSRKKLTPVNSIKEVITQMHYIIDQFSHIVQSIKLQIAITIQSVMKNVQKQIKYFLNEYVTSQRSDIIFSTATFGQNQLRQTHHEIQQLKSLQNLVATSKIVRTDSIIDQLEMYEKINMPTNIRESDKQKQHQKQRSGGIFSNMIKMRQNIRKDATNAVPKKQIKKTLDQHIDNFGDISPLPRINELKRDPSQRSPLIRASGSREMTKSIQKIQLRLSSLKNLLDE